MEKFTFAPIQESTVAREITSRYMQEMLDYAETDVVVVGAGPAGLTAAYELGKHGVKTAIIEANIAPGGGAWVGGQLFSAMVVRKPAHYILDELGVSYDDKGNYVVLRHAGMFTATILSKVLNFSNVKLFNGVAVEDLITHEGVVKGVVTNWMAVTKLHGQQCCMDPNVMEAKMVVSSCGHDGPFGASGVKRLAQIGLINKVPGMKSLNMQLSEDAVVANTCEIVPGMVVCGMEVAEAYGCHRMGPSFGGMLVSGYKAAGIVLQKLGVKKNGEAEKDFLAVRF